MSWGFRLVQEKGVIEIITAQRRTGFALMEGFPEAVRAQIHIARKHYRENIGRDPRGIWLPECAYFSGLESVLAKEEIRWLCSIPTG